MQTEYVRYSELKIGDSVKLAGGGVWRNRCAAETSPAPFLTIVAIEPAPWRGDLTLVTDDGQRVKQPKNGKALRAVAEPAGEPAPAEVDPAAARLAEWDAASAAYSAAIEGYHSIRETVYREEYATAKAELIAEGDYHGRSSVPLVRVTARLRRDRDARVTASHEAVLAAAARARSARIAATRPS